MTMAGRLPEPYGQSGGANLADILERVLDKGIVIAGDIRINLLDIELLTIKLRLIVASVDKAKEMGIDWWEDDPALSSRAHHSELARENRELRDRLAELEGAGAEREISRADHRETSRAEPARETSRTGRERETTSRAEPARETSRAGPEETSRAAPEEETS